MGYARHGRQTYFDAPEHGIRGRRAGTDVATRLLGLEPLLEPERCRGARVLDLGCAEGLIGLELVRRGAACVHGFDLQEVSVAEASRVFRDVPGPHAFRQADLTDLDAFERAHADLLLPRYDLVLLLGVYHHVAGQAGAATAMRLLDRAAARTAGLLAVRTKAPLPAGVVERRGLRRAWEHAGDPSRATGELVVYEACGGDGP